MKSVEIKNLNIGFNTENGFRQALFDVSFNLYKGTMSALVGESGCGKTLSAMSILNLLPKSAVVKSGEVIFNSQNLLSLNNKAMQKIRGEKIALIPQDPMTSLNPLYTIGNQLLEVIKIHQNLQGKEACKKALEALDAVQIPAAKERINSYPHEFSGGMKQRAIIAMALCCNAEVLIADEPTTALDVTIQAQIMNILKEIKEERQTSILLITHDLGLVRDNADIVSVMYSGRIIESAPVEEFFNKTSHPYSIALLESLPANRNRQLDTIKGQPPTIHENISGCRFNPRCKKCMDICTKEVPPQFPIAKDHFSACFLNDVKS